VVEPDAGEIRIDGRSVHFASPKDAQQSGIGTVFQELSLMPMLSVAENVYPHRAPVTRGGFIRWSALYRQAQALLAPFGVQVDVRALVERLPTSTRQVVEIAKALSLDARVLLLDEPTSALTPDESAALFAVVRQLKARGIGIVYISHHLHEVFELADRITVLRDGRKIDTLRRADTDTARIVRMMVGRDLSAMFEPRRGTRGQRLLRAERLGHTGTFRDVTLDLHAGEIVGLAGLMGSRRSELGQALAGALQPTAGTIAIDGRPVTLRHVADAIDHGIAYLPAERKTEGLFLDHSIADNVIAASLPQFSDHGLLATARRDSAAQDYVARLNVRAADVQQPVGRLSGGNQQKVLLAKWLVTKPRLLIVDEPTRGIDVGAKAEIHALLRRLADDGAGLLVISSDLPELLGLADRIVVMHEGRISGEMPASVATEEALLHCAVGLPPTTSPLP
ncbi:MAG TPA: sugar ABC transporter ATP-binding protein, partial [Albitalea sp.]|nr:sugar ABC transporter ATP-binding protein [Albitalea sp.]